MDDEAIIEKVLELGNPGGNASVSSRTKFLHGILYSVEFRSAGIDPIVAERFFYENTSGESSVYPRSKAFSSRHELMSWMDGIYEKQHNVILYSNYNDERESFLFRGLSDIRVVSAVIGIMITATISFLLITDLRHKQINRTSEDDSQIALIEIPDVLSNALAIILGFYFGSEVGKSKERAEPRDRD